jgi:hypothetical protein
MTGRNALRSVATIGPMQPWDAKKDGLALCGLALAALGARGALDEGGEIRLRFGVAMNPDEWRHFLPTGLHFRVRVDDRVVFERFLDPRRTLDDRRWIYADVPLAEVRLDAATAARISFEASTDNGYGTMPSLAGFASPELVAISHP